jgi:hypothetical protein
MNDQSGWKNGFVFVRDVYRNCVRILLSADILMEERGYGKYGWKNVYDMDPIEDKWRDAYMNNLTQADCLLTGFLFHQYYQRGLENHDIITICTAPWRRIKSDAFRPACCITRFIAKSTPNEVYWIGTMPLWEEYNPVDGTLKEYDFNSGMLSEPYRKRYNDIVSEEKKLIGISVPLHEITSSSDVENKLLKPLLETQVIVQ